jgi:hypothetical protein
MTLQVDVADLLRGVIANESATVVAWLCKVRDADLQGKPSKKVSKACDAVLSSLVRLFCAKYVSRGLALLEGFRDLLVTCTDATIDQHARWQRVCNLCAFLMVNEHKPRTVHVLPNLLSPLMELDENEPEQRQERMPGAARWFAVYAQKLLEKHVSDVDLNVAGDSPVHVWLHSDPLNTPAFRPYLMLLELKLQRRQVKDAHRLITYLVLHGKSVSTARHSDVMSCMWHAVSLVSTHLHATDRLKPDAQSYVACAESIFFCLVPAKRIARLCRLSLLYYAVMILCDNRTRRVNESNAGGVLNLPVTVPRQMQYLSIFPHGSRSG